MATGAEVLQQLLPDGGWTISGDDFEGIDFHGGKTITQAEFLAGFSNADAYKAQQDAAKAQARAALLAKLGISAEEAALLLS